MKPLLFVLCIALLIIAPCSAITCSNVKLSFSGTGETQHEIIPCNSIENFEISPELSFLTITQNGNSLSVSGDITGRKTFGYVTIYGQSQPGATLQTREGIRIPVSINAGTPTPTATQTVITTVTTKPTPTATKTPVPTRTTYAALPEWIGLAALIPVLYRYKTKKKG